MSGMFVILKCFFTILLCRSLLAASPIVKIRNGTLEGLLMTTRYDRKIIGFRGIPYALPPLGELRFQVFEI